MDKYEELYKYFINKLESDLTLKKYYKKEYIFTEDIHDEKIYILKKGFVEISKITLTWEERLIFILSPKYILNEEILFSDSCDCSTNCLVCEDAEVYIINKKKLLSVMEKDFKICEFVLLNTNLKLKRTYRQLKNSGTNVNLDKKIAAKLWKLNLDYGEETSEGSVINVPLSSTLISKMVGAKRESVSRRLNYLKKIGVIDIKNERITIKNKDYVFNMLEKH